MFACANDSSHQPLLLIVEDVSSVMLRSLDRYLRFFREFHSQKAIGVFIEREREREREGGGGEGERSYGERSFRERKRSRRL